MRTETLAVVFTDIKGYTAATSAQTHQENANMLRRIERLIEPVVRAYDGRVVKSIGDAYMIVFRSPTEAVRCATAVQDRLHEHNAGVSIDQAIHIRIAMNVGEVRVHRGDVFGEPVNIAARIEGITPADEVYISKAVYLTMNRTDLPTELVGDYELKGLPEPVTVYRVKKFVSLEQTIGPDTAEIRIPKAAGLPFGGLHLRHWRRMLWVRAAYYAAWVMGLSGMGLGAYLRYRPAVDYSALVSSVKMAIDQDKPMDALAAAGQLPVDALQERSIVRRYRRDAVQELLNAGNFEPAEQEIKSLLKEDRRDAEALLLRGLVMSKRGAEPKATLEVFSQALKLEATLAENVDMVNVVVGAYGSPTARTLADSIIENYIKQRAIVPLQKLAADSSFESRSRHLIGLRLERLGAADAVDWVTMSLDDLRSTNCVTRKNAIGRLVNEGDERAVGPLMKFSQSKQCGAKEAKNAADQIMGKK